MEFSAVSRFLGLAALFGVLAGCGGARNPNAPATISGRVTYNGDPVPAGTIQFHGANSLNTVNIEKDGTYLGTDFTVGEMTVTIETESVNPDRGKTFKKYPGESKATVKDKGDVMKGMPRPEGVAGATAQYVKIPAKYADKTKSGLTVTLVAGKQTKNFELND